MGGYNAMEEFAFINWIRGHTPADPDRAPVGPGDDCAVVRFAGELLLVTTDQCADGVHFRLDECGCEAAGYKVMARSLSDIAAMAGEPVAAVATAALPKGLSESDAQAVYRGLRRAGDAFDCPVVGGDVAAWDHPLLLTVTMWGRPVGAGPILRSGANVGDAICVTGTLGGSLVSGKHLSFTPRIAEARALLEHHPPTAMIDISDGLAADLAHICRESHVGAELNAAAIPLSDAARAGADPLAAALGDGEDYELLFTLPPQAAADLVAAQPLGAPVSRIGGIRREQRMILSLPDGASTPLDAGGYQHRT